MTDGAWPPDEIATLAAIAETFVRGDAVRRANLAVRAVDRSLDPEQIAGLRRVLRIAESPLRNLLLSGRPARFRDLDPPARERYLLGWGASRIAQRRSAFAALRQLLTFLAYADPGDTGTNPRWRTIGYAPERAPVTDDLTSVRPFALPGSSDGVITLEADVVVVGSGAGGGVVAADLASAGKSVVVLDAGPFVDERTLPATELAAFDELFVDHGMAATWDGSITLLAGAAVGGGTIVNWMTVARPPDDVRHEWRRDHGIDDATFDGDATRLAAELSVAPAAMHPAKDALILRGAKALGWAASTIDRNASGCTDCGSCGFGCPRGTKASGIRAHLASAHRAGARIVANARCERVLIEAGRAAGVEATVTQNDGTVTLRVRSSRVVVSAGALGTPGVLQRSGVDHPAIGSNLRIHPVSGVLARMLEPVRMWVGPSQAARVDEFAAAEAGRNGYVIESAPAHVGLLAQAIPWEGTEAHATLMDRAAFIAPLIAVTRDGGEGRVSVTKHGHTRIDYRLDRSGVATLRHALRSMARLARAAGAREIVAAGTPPATFGRLGFPVGGEARVFASFERELERFDFAPNRGSVFSAHQMGTARMGSDRRQHAVDPDGRVRSGRADARVAGLYVADGSLFPTGIGVNPMLTIMLLARHVARTVVAES